MTSDIQKLNRRLANVEALALGLGGAPQLAYSSLEDGVLSEYDGAGTLVSSWGKQFDGTHTQVTFAGPPPPEPVPARVTPGPLSLTVRWSGRFVDDALSPMDFQQVEVHISEDPEFDASTTATLRATIRGELGDEVVISPLPNLLHYVRLVARSTAGKASTPSVATEGTPDAIAASTDDGKMTVEPRPPTTEDGEGKPENALWNQVDPVTGAQVAVWRWDGTVWVDFPISETMLPLVNIAEGTYGKLKGVQLEAKAIDGMRITGAIIQTSISPDRGLKFTETDLVAYNGDGDQTFRLDAGTGDASLLGHIRAGSTITGATVTGGMLQNSERYDGFKIDLGVREEGWGASGGIVAYDGNEYYEPDGTRRIMSIWSQLGDAYFTEVHTRGRLEAEGYGYRAAPSGSIPNVTGDLQYTNQGVPYLTGAANGENPYGIAKVATFDVTAGRATLTHHSSTWSRPGAENGRRLELSVEDATPAIRSCNTVQVFNVALQRWEFQRVLRPLQVQSSRMDLNAADGFFINGVDMTPGQWVTLSLAPGVVQRPGAQYTPRARISAGQIFITGSIDRTASNLINTGQQTVLTLPAQFWADYEVAIPVTTATAVNSWIRPNNGQLVVAGSGTAGFQILNVTYSR